MEHEHDLHPLDGTPFTECSGCHAIFDGETMLVEPLDTSGFEKRTYDEHADTSVLKEAERDEDGWSLTTVGSTGLFLNNERAGDRVFSPGDGLRVISFNGSYLKGIYHRPSNDGPWECVFHRTDEEQRQEDLEHTIGYHRKRAIDFAGHRDKLDADYASLPTAFQRRIDKYRENNPSFRVEFEGYEMFCCTQAVVFAETAVKVTSPAAAVLDRIDMGTLTPEQREKAMKWYEAWAATKDYAEQKKLMPGLSDGHSGNTFGMAANFGALYLSGRMDGVVEHFGAMAPLVGSDQYGDVPREKASA